MAKKNEFGEDLPYLVILRQVYTSHTQAQTGTRSTGAETKGHLGTGLYLASQPRVRVVGRRVLLPVDSCADIWGQTEVTHVPPLPEGLALPSPSRTPICYLQQQWLLFSKSPQSLPWEQRCGFWSHGWRTCWVTAGQGRARQELWTIQSCLDSPGLREGRCQW